MMNYYNINTHERSSKPKSKRTSNLWLNPERLKDEGWLPIVEKEPTQEGRVVRYDYEILKTQVNKIPIVKVDKKPSKEKWEKINRAEEVDHSDWVEQKYTKETIPIEEFKEQKVNQIKSSARELIFEHPFKELEKWVAKQIKSVGDATAHVDVDAVSTEFIGVK